MPPGAPAELEPAERRGSAAESAGDLEEVRKNEREGQRLAATLDIDAEIRAQERSKRLHHGRHLGLGDRNEAPIGGPGGIEQAAPDLRVAGEVRHVHRADREAAAPALD